VTEVGAEKQGSSWKRWVVGITVGLAFVIVGVVFVDRRRSQASPERNADSDADLATEAASTRLK
jgi:hypothetical protein